MKNFIYILGLLLLVGFQSCKEPERIAGFEDAEQYSIYNYLLENEEQFSDFLQILKAGNLDKTLSAYNPYGTGYTLFAPDNEAVDAFIAQNDQFSNLNDILENTEYAAAFSRYHVVNMRAHTNDFPFGAFPEPTLSEDFLTVSFIIEPDTSYYKINNQAAVVLPNTEVSNGYIHQIQIALEPITFTSYDWLRQNSEFSIFADAVDLTGLESILDVNLKDDDRLIATTILAEADFVYKENEVNNVDDLANLISPDDNDYTSESNALNSFIRYHLLSGGYFIDDFEGDATNYSTYSEIPLNINGVGIDILINQGKEVFDTIINNGDTTIIDYIGLKYDESNVITQSGSIHSIDRIMTQQDPSRSNRRFEFYEEPLIVEYRKEPGTYELKQKDSLQFINWTGSELYFVELGEEESSAWGSDYLEMDGDFTIAYEIPKIVQGKYTVYLRAEAFNSSNALVEIFVDGKKVSGLIDLSSGGTAGSPFQTIELGTIDFVQYEKHLVEIKPLIPGRFLWDWIRFEPA